VPESNGAALRLARYFPIVRTVTAKRNVRVNVLGEVPVSPRTDKSTENVALGLWNVALGPWSHALGPLNVDSVR
jgi:hypothetical protein